MADRECEECGSDISHKKSDARFCGTNCSARLRARKRLAERDSSPRPARFCLWCDADISLKNSRAKFCGTPCYQRHSRKAEWLASNPECPACGASIAHRRSDTVYCDHRCKWAHKTRDRIKRYGTVSAARDAWVATDPRCLTCGESVAHKSTNAKYCDQACMGQTARQVRGYSVSARRVPRVVLLRWGFKNPHPRGSREADRWKYLSNQEERLEQARAYSRESYEVNAARRARRRARKRGYESRVVRGRDVAQIKNRQCGKCYYCGGKTAEMHLDHVVPLARGGRNAIGNLVLSCASCNLSKSDKLLIEWKSESLIGGGRNFPNPNIEELSVCFGVEA